LKKKELEKEQALRGEPEKSKAMLIITNKEGIVKIDWRFIKTIYKGKAITGNIPKKRGVLIYDLRTIRKYVNEWEMKYIEKYEMEARKLRVEIREQRKYDMTLAKKKRKEEVNETNTSL
jgi:hypothetical protein